jgi:hypothetical protein
MPVKWSEAEIDEALRWYAQQHRMTVFTSVPVTLPRWHGWGPNCRKRLDTVAVPSAGQGTVTAFDENAFRTALSEPRPIHPILVWGYANRPAFGYLATRQAFLARSWHPNGPVRPVALVAPGRDRPNTTSAYFAAGFDIIATPGVATRRTASSRGQIARNDPWEAPRSVEDRYLHELWRNRQRVGWWLAEVPIGQGAARRIDAVVIESPRPRRSKAGADLRDFGVAVAEGGSIELIEAKARLNPDVIGQLLCGAHLFGESWPGHGPLSLTACVAKPRDEALQWYCARHGDLCRSRHRCQGHQSRA